METLELANQLLGKSFKNLQDLNYFLQKEHLSEPSFQIGGRLPNANEMMLLRELGMVDEIMTTDIPKNLVVVTSGGTTKAILRRLLWLKMNNIEPQRIIFICSDRALSEMDKNLMQIHTDLQRNFVWIDPVQKFDKILPNLKTEHQMIEILASCYRLLHEIIPAKNFADGLQRLNINLVQRFLSEPGYNLALLLGQPWAGYQGLTAKRILNREIDIIAPASPPQITLRQYIDALARTIYELTRS